MTLPDTKTENAPIILEAIRRNASDKTLNQMLELSNKGIALSGLISNPSAELKNPEIELPNEVTEKY
jgi:hypothetical protein